MASLTCLALQHVSLEDLIEIGLDNLPVTSDFISGLAQNVCPEIASTYKGNWIAFREDLVFLLQSSGIPLMYSNVCLMWRHVGSDYLLIVAREGTCNIVVTTYDQLADVIKDIMTTLSRYSIRASQSERYSSISDIFSDESADVYRFMAGRKQDDVNCLKTGLSEGRMIALKDRLLHLSCYPFDENISAIGMVVDQSLVIIGLSIGDDFDDPDPEFGATSYPYLCILPVDQLDLFLGLIAYNQRNYLIL